MNDEEFRIRPYVVVDVETNGLDYEMHEVVEVAWWNLDTDERGHFVPSHDVSGVLARADIRALQINRYVDRIASAKQDNGDESLRLYRQLAGAVLVGSNPRLDAAMLRKMFGNDEPWHYRLLDVGAYGAGVLGTDPDEGVPGLWRLCQLLDVPLTPEDAHTAVGDVTATGEVLRALWRYSAERVTRR
jgi:DNA polymerase-3 subunit epsilon